MMFGINTGPTNKSEAIDQPFGAFTAGSARRHEQLELG